MDRCNQCGNSISDSDVTCSKCGASMIEMKKQLAKHDTASGTPNPKLSEYAAQSPYLFQAIGVVAFTVLACLILSYISSHRTGSSFWMLFAWAVWFVALVPLTAGAIVVAMKGAKAPRLVEWSSEWIESRAQLSNQSNSRFNQYVVRPTFWAFASLNARAVVLEDQVLRNGAKVAANVFAVCLFLFLAYMLTVIALGVIMFVAILWLSWAIISHHSGGNVPSVKTMLSPFRGSTTYSGTNVFNEQVTGRTDPEGNMYKGTNFFNEEKVGRIDPAGNLYQGTNFLNEQKIGRIDKDGIVYSGSNMFNEERVGRIDEDGNILEGASWFSEKEIGRVMRD